MVALDPAASCRPPRFLRARLRHALCCECICYSSFVDSKILFFARHMAQNGLAGLIKVEKFLSRVNFDFVPKKQVN